MRKLIFLLMGFFIWQSALSQYTNEDRYIALNMNLGNNVAKIQNRTYTASTVDTTEWLDIANLANVYLTLQSKDSCTLLINYQLSIDRVALGVSTLIDSLSSSAAAGNLKSLNALTTAIGSPYVRYIFTGSAKAFPEGTTTNTYTAKALLKKY